MFHYTILYIIMVFSANFFVNFIILIIYQPNKRNKLKSLILVHSFVRPADPAIKYVKYNYIIYMLKKINYVYI